MCVWLGFVAVGSVKTSGSSKEHQVKVTHQQFTTNNHHQPPPPRVHACRWCMPEKMADSRFQAVPQPMNLAAAAAAPPDMPDLSHLTEEERRIIESVMMRQRQEEERENEIMR